MTSAMEETLSRLSPNIFTRNINYHRRMTYSYTRVYICIHTHTHTRVQGNKHEWKVLNVSSETRVNRKHGSGFRVPMQQWIQHTHVQCCSEVVSASTRWKTRPLITFFFAHVGAGARLYARFRTSGRGCWSVGACSALLKELPRTRGSYGDDGD